MYFDCGNDSDTGMFNLKLFRQFFVLYFESGPQHRDHADFLEFSGYQLQTTILVEDTLLLSSNSSWDALATCGKVRQCHLKLFPY
jgi:hypothetical protein